MSKKFLKFYQQKILYCRNRENFLKVFSILLPIFIMALLTIPNLGNRELWFDEAHNVAIGENVVKYGIPRVWDGKRLIALSEDSHINFIEVYLNWFPYYLAAFGQLFSKSLFCVRIWFVILGLASALCQFFMTYENFKDEKLALLTLWLYCLSIPVIIYVKVAYYYAPALLFINSSYLFFLKAMKYGGGKYYVLFSISMILLLYSNYLFFGIFIIFVVVTYALFFRNNIKKFVLCLFFIGVFILPYVLARGYHILTYGLGYERQNFNGFWTQFPGQLWEVQAYFMPFITFVIMYGIKKIFIYVKRNKDKGKEELKDDITNRKEKNNKYYLLFIFLIILNTALISYLTRDYATRYLIISLPFCNILNAAFILKYFKNDHIARALFILLFISTNIIHEAPYFVLKDIHINKVIEEIVKPPVVHYESPIVTTEITTLKEYVNKVELKSFLLIYLKSYLKDYDCAEEGASLFLKKYGKDGETFINFTVSRYQVLYHTNLIPVQYENENSVVMNEEYFQTGRPVTWARNLKYRFLVYKPIEYVDWIVVNPQDIELEGNSRFVTKEVYEKLVDEDLFERYDLPEYPLAPFSADIWSYTFETDYNYEGVTIFRNKKTTEDIDVPSVVPKVYLEN